MSKSDLPPSYEESRQQQHGNYPYAGYGYPAQGPGPPGIPPPAGYCPSAMPSMIPSFITPGILPSDPRDAEGISSTGVWDSMSVRHAFIRKVYLILSVQLLITSSIIAVFTLVPVYLVTYLMLVCCEVPRRRHPWNLILLFIFTLALSYMTGTISSYFATKAVFLALGITAIVCIIVTIFSFQTKVPWLQMLYGACGAIVFTLFLAYHTQLLVGTRANSISPEEYVFGALSLYVDIVQIFIFLLDITGSSSE